MPTFNLIRNTFPEELCIKCKGRGWCGKQCKILQQIKKYQPRIKEDFSGSTPPEIFVGHHNYPYVYTGVLAPNEYGDTTYLSMPEIWHSNKVQIQDILSYRAKLIYSRFISNIKTSTKRGRNKFIDTLQQIAMAYKPIDASFKLRKKPTLKITLDSHVALIGNPAPLEKISIESNPKIERKVDYLINDTDVNATTSIHELYSANVSISNIIKILSAGLLGLKFQRKLVPTRWAVTAVDDSISKNLIKKIKSYQVISSYLVFKANYLGNYYSIILLPRSWSFEVIEASAKGYFGYGLTKEKIAMWHDYEFFCGRKEYASSVTGAYYANRLGVCEYLEKIKRQASCLIMREVREEYWAPCGVGILREVTREAMTKKPERFNSLDEALNSAQANFRLPISIYVEKSKILKDVKCQKTLTSF